MTEKKGQPPSPSGTPTSIIPEVEVHASPTGTPTSIMGDTIPRASPPEHGVTVSPPKRVKPPSAKPAALKRRRPRVRRPRTGIGSSMISWNEANTIDLALKGLVGLVDEVVVVDTGSFDGTRIIANEWIDALDLSGEVASIRTKNLGDARAKALELCSSNWVILQDSNIVLSERLASEFRRHIREDPEYQLAVRSLNLMGDYRHYFAAMPFHAPHRMLVRKDREWKKGMDWQVVDMPRKTGDYWAVNLSRVRPAWRCWYRGEPFDRKMYFPKGARKGAVGHMHELNIQYQWQIQTEYYSLIDFVKATKELSLEDVKKAAPKWYLNYLRSEATPIRGVMQLGLPKTIKHEQKDPRYRLIYRGHDIVGRRPEL